MLREACVCDMVGGARRQIVSVRWKITLLIGNKVGLGFYLHGWPSQVESIYGERCVTMSKMLLIHVLLISFCSFLKT